MKSPKGYRELKIGQKIKAGDIMINLTPVDSSIGEKYNPVRHFQGRFRKIEEKTKKTETQRITRFGESHASFRCKEILGKLNSSELKELAIAIGLNIEHYNTRASILDGLCICLHIY